MNCSISEHNPTHRTWDVDRESRGRVDSYLAFHFLQRVLSEPMTEVSTGQCVGGLLIRYRLSFS
jgi:hypothetical protein